MFINDIKLYNSLPRFYKKEDGMYMDEKHDGTLKKCPDDYIIPIPAHIDNGPSIFMTASEYFSSEIEPFTYKEAINIIKNYKSFFDEETPLSNYAYKVFVKNIISRVE